MTKIISLKSTNYKRLQAVEITPDPDGNLVIVAGKNGQGKSSILDSITAALGGVNAKTTPKPIRDGEERAEIILETEDLIVTRKFTASGSTLTVKSPDGAVYPKGQARLDDLLGKLSLDPLAFTQLGDKEQLATLLGVVELPFDPLQIERDRAKLFAKRTEANRNAKELGARLAGHSVEPGDPLYEVSLNDLLAEYRNVEAEQLRLKRTEQALDVLNRQKADMQRQLAEIEREIAAAEIDQIRAADDMTDRSLEAMQERIDNVEDLNRAARRNSEWITLKESFDFQTSEAEDLTKEIEKIDQKKRDGLAAAVFPVDELGFDESGVTFKGVPFKQASSAEQLRVSLAMAIALNPKLRVIRIADGSLLDSDNLALVESIARKHDFQVWIEMVGDGDGRGIIIEDGAIAGA